MCEAMLAAMIFPLIKGGKMTPTVLSFSDEKNEILDLLKSQIIIQHYPVKI